MCCRLVSRASFFQHSRDRLQGYESGRISLEGHRDHPWSLWVVSGNATTCQHDDFGISCQWSGFFWQETVSDVFPTRFSGATYFTRNRIRALQVSLVGCWFRMMKWFSLMKLGQHLLDFSMLLAGRRYSYWFPVDMPRLRIPATSKKQAHISWPPPPPEGETTEEQSKRRKTETEARRRSDSIDLQLKLEREEKEKIPPGVKILLLGEIRCIIALKSRE